MARVRKPGTPANAKNVSFLRNKAKEQKEARLQDLESLGARPQAKPGRTLLLHPDSATLQETIEFVLRLALVGNTYRDIERRSEEELGYKVTATRAKTLFTREMARKKDPLVSEIRKKEDARLDYWMTKLEDKIEEGDVQAIHEARLISESRRKMWGADMPANVRITGEVQHSLDPAVELLFRQAQQKEAEREQEERKEIEDGRIIDAQVIEDESDPDYRTETYQEEIHGFDDAEEDNL